jgi:hypothetical protein
LIGHNAPPSVSRRIIILLHDRAVLHPGHPPPVRVAEVTHRVGAAQGPGGASTEAGFVVRMETVIALANGSGNQAVDSSAALQTTAIWLAGISRQGRKGGALEPV